ncbi:MAG: hypothetical protein ACXABG_15230 [Promethearchaeota archaeon]|jgi:hypothetical protein
MSFHHLSDSEKTFISAYEDLRNNLWEGLIEARDWTYESWKPFWEVTRLLRRLYAGEEKIVKRLNKSISIAE